MQNIVQQNISVFIEVAWLKKAVLLRFGWNAQVCTQENIEIWVVYFFSCFDPCVRIGVVVVGGTFCICSSLHFTHCLLDKNTLSLCSCVHTYVCAGQHERVKWCKIMCLAYWHIVMYVNTVWLKSRVSTEALLLANSSPLLRFHRSLPLFLSLSAPHSKQVKCLKRCIEVSLCALHDGYVMWHNASERPSQIKWQMLFFASWIFFWPSWIWDFKFCSPSPLSLWFCAPCFSPLTLSFHPMTLRSLPFCFSLNYTDTITA